MRTLKLTEKTKKELLGNLLNRNPGSYTEYENTVNEIINDIRNNGDKALFEYTAKFDKCTLDASCIKITDDEIKEAYDALDPEFIEVMKKSAENIRVFHEKKKEIPGSIQGKTEVFLARGFFLLKYQVFMFLVERLRIQVAYL